MSSDYIKEISAYNIRRARPRPGKCALMVIDMQEYFRALALPILNNVLSVIEACRSSGIHIVFTRHGHKDISKDGGMLGKWWGDRPAPRKPRLLRRGRGEL